MKKDILLKGKTAIILYEKFAKDAPIYDYHCHLSAKDIYEDRIFSDISSMWLGYDHYKWRVMRYAGIDEKYITGTESGVDKFISWARTYEKLVGNPLYQWTRMELKTYFGVEDNLNESNARDLYAVCNKKIMEDELSPVKMIQKSKVKLICTTDDPIDTLEYHALLKEKKGLEVQVLPTFRPDKSFQIGKEDYITYLEKLGQSCKIRINTYEKLMEALNRRIQHFNKTGCLLADHSMESLTFFQTTFDEVNSIFTRRLAGEKITKEDSEKFKTYLLLDLAKEYKKFNWVLQLHIGAYRNTNTKMFEKIGADTGYDIMNDFNIVEPLTQILNAMELRDGLPKTILYTLNSKDNLVLSSMPHSFTEGGIPGKIQFGPAWWFCDHKEGIVEHLKSMASQGMLANFIGMLTDSRSFLSYVRHDYFRRILCNYIGELVDGDEFTNEEAILKEVIEGICYKNIITYLGMEVKA